MDAFECSQCGRQQPDAAAGDKCRFCGGELKASEAGSLPIPPPPPPDPGLVDTGLDDTGLEPGKRACPQCGETLYETERRCWRCGHELPLPSVDHSVEPPPLAPEPPLSPAPPVVGPPEPVSATPVTPPVGPPVSPVPLAHPLKSSAADRARVLGNWSLAVGIIQLFCCLGLLGPLAIYLGVRANRAGTSRGTAAIVLGVIGTILFVILFILGLIGSQVPDDPIVPPTTLLLSDLFTC